MSLQSSQCRAGIWLSEDRDLWCSDILEDRLIPQQSPTNILWLWLLPRKTLTLINLKKKKQKKKNWYYGYYGQFLAKSADSDLTLITKEWWCCANKKNKAVIFKWAVFTDNSFTKCSWVLISFTQSSVWQTMSMFEVWNVEASPTPQKGTTEPFSRVPLFIPNHDPIPCYQLTCSPVECSR